MKAIVTLAAAAALASIIGLSTAQAAPAVNQSPLPTLTVQDLLQPVHYPHARCGWWRRECSYRWGFGSWRFARCMRRHYC